MDITGKLTTLIFVTLAVFATIKYVFPLAGAVVYFVTQILMCILRVFTG